MWGKKKPVASQAADSKPTNLRTNQLTKFPPTSWERTPKMDNAAIGSTGAAPDRVTSRLGVNLHMKGEMCGNEDLHVDGEVDGRIRLDEGKLTVGTDAKITADIIAGEVVVSGNVKGNVRPQTESRSRSVTYVSGTICYLCSIKGEVKKKHFPPGRSFFCFAAHANEQDLF